MRKIIGKRGRRRRKRKKITKRYYYSYIFAAAYSIRLLLLNLPLNY